MRVRLGDYIKEYSVKNKNNEDIPVYSVSNSLGFCKDYFGKEVASKNKTTYKIVPRGCFAYNPSRINVGSVDWQNEEERVIVSPLYNVFSVSPLLDQQYLLYYLKSNVTLSRIRAVASGSVRDNLKLSMLYEFPIDLISLDKQYDVVSTLNAVQKIIDLYQKGLSYLDELVRARFVEMFGDPMINPYEWQVINISEVLRAKASNGFFSRRDDYCDDGNVKVLGVANVVNRMYSQVVDLPRTNANEKDIEKFEVKYGDMLFCRSSLVAEGIGKASIIPEGVQTNILFECHVIRLPLDLDKCVPEFLQTLSTTKFFRNQIISKSKTATMTTIGQDGILKTNIILPPLEKQKEYYNFVKQIDKSRLLSNHSLFLIKSLIF